jgi:hypothetical protein
VTFGTWPAEFIGSYRVDVTLRAHWILDARRVHEARSIQETCADHNPVLQHPTLVTSKHSPVTLAMTEKPFQPLK